MSTIQTSIPKSGTPKFSVVTASFNAIAGLRLTAASLASQTFRDFEWIVVDGGSNDGTREFIESLGHRVSKFIWEPDEGIHDAWNKGVSLANGEFVAFLNADDLYHPNALAQASEACAKNPDAIVVGKTCLVREGEIVQTYCARPVRNFKMSVGFPHPSTFMPRKMFSTYGPFANKRISMDTDFLLRPIKQGVKVVPADFTVYMAFGGISTTKPVSAFREYQSVLIEHGLQSKSGAFFYTALYATAHAGRTILSDYGPRYMARNIKHAAVLLMNLLFRLVCIDPFRQLLFKLLGMKVARSSWIAPTTTMYSLGNLTVGVFSVINRGCLLDNRSQITIGNNVSIAYGCSIVTAGHDINAPYFDYFERPVVIENHAVLFAKVMLMPGAVIGEGSVILPNSVVSGFVPPFSVYGGIPARFIRDRTKNLYYSISYKFPFSL
jgi:acetyltransferase-like isoleucine patch superfamily enzyme